MSSGEARFLIAMPSLKGPIFQHSVILMAEYDDKGSLGFIVNLPTGTTAKEALKVMNFDHIQTLDIPILFGGPVQTDFFWVIHSPEFTGITTMKIHDGFYLTSAQELMPLLNNPDCPTIHFCGVGYAGWGTGQLEREIEEGAWWLGDFDISLLFDTEHLDRWNEAFKFLGADPNSLVDKTDPADPVIN